MEPFWGKPMIDEATIREAVNRLQEAAPGARVILFGSYGRGDARADSDLDFLVIEPEVDGRHDEMVRLRQVLRPMRIPVDVLVTSRSVFQQWCDTPGTILYEAAREGRVFDEVA